MFISSAAAHTATNSASTHGDATALSIILAVGVMLFLAYSVYKKRRKRRLNQDGSGE